MGRCPAIAAWAWLCKRGVANTPKLNSLAPLQHPKWPLQGQGRGQSSPQSQQLPEVDTGIVTGQRQPHSLHTKSTIYCGGPRGSIWGDAESNKREAFLLCCGGGHRCS